MSDIQLGQLIYKITGDSSQLDSAIKKSEKSVFGFKKVLGALGAAFAFKQVVDGFVSIVKAGSDLGESQNAVNKVFKDSSGIIDDYSKTASKTVGLSAKAFNELATVTGAQFKTAGINTEQAAKQTINLTERAADLASVYNTSVKDALGALGSALRGEAEPARRFAINISEAAVEQEALASGMVKSKAEITDAIKVQARYNIILKQSKDTAGDFADTSDGLANQQRILASTFEDIQAKVGGPLASVFASTGTTLNDMATSFNDWLSTAEGLEVIDATAKTFAITMSIIFALVRQLGTAFMGVFDIAKVGFKGLTDAFKALSKGDFSGAFDSLAGMRAGIFNTYKDFTIDTVDNVKKTSKEIGDILSKDYTKLSAVGDDAVKKNKQVGKEIVEDSEATAKALEKIAKKKENEAKFVEGLDKSLKALEAQKQVASQLGEEFDLLAAKKDLLKGAFADASSEDFLTALEKIKKAMSDLGVDKVQKDFKTVFDSMTAEAVATMEAVISALGSVDAFLDAKLERDLERVDEETQKKLEAAGLQEETEIEKLENEIAMAEAKGDTITANELRNELARTKIIEDGEKKKAKLRYESELKSWKIGRATILLEGAIAQIRAISAGLSFGPAAVVMVPLLSALALAGTVFSLAAHSQAKPQAPTFETGGFVPGNSFSGDRVDIRANSGEAVLTTDQQKNFMDIANGSGGAGNVVLQLVTQTGRELKKWIFEGTRDGTIKIDNSALVSVGI